MKSSPSVSKFIFITFLLMMLSATLVSAQSRIAILKSSNLPPFESALTGFKKYFEETGTKVELAEYTLTDGNDNVNASVKNFSPALIVPIGSNAARYAAENFQNTPIVFSMVLYPKQTGIVKDKGSAEITGASLDISLADQFRTINEIIPHAKKVGVLYSAAETGTIIEKAQKEAAKFGLQLLPVPVQSTKEVPDALQGLERKVDVLWSVADNAVFGGKMTEFIISYTLEHDLPLMGLSPAFVEAGAPFALSQDYSDIGKQTAELSVKVLSGQNAREIEITEPRGVTVVLNLRTAREIGIKIPDDIIKKASKKIQ